MPQATFACCYFVFAILFATVNYIVQDVSSRSEMYEAVVDKYVQQPHRFKPLENFEHIEVPKDLYLWVTQSFVPVSYSEKAENGDDTGFCTKGFNCDIDEGQCKVNSQCNTGLTCKDGRALSNGFIVNGQYWDEHELVDWCNYLGSTLDLTRLTTNVDTTTRLQDCTDDPSLTGSKGPCCWDSKTQAYITAIDSRADDSSVPVSSIDGLIGRGNCPIALGPSADCCAVTTVGPYTETDTDRLNHILTSGDGRPVTVGNFNRMLYLRATMKRYKMKGETSHAAFSGVMPQVLDQPTPLSPNSDNGKHEDKSSVPSLVNVPYTWVKNNSYAEAGGYVIMVNPAKGASLMRFNFDRLRMDGLFDNRLATVVIDAMYYNGNSDTFMYVAFKFTFTPAGTCIKQVETMFCNLMNSSFKGQYSISLAITNFVLIPMVICFFLVEFSAMHYQTLYVHFVQKFPNTWIDLFSLVLCASVLAMNYVINNRATYKDFAFGDHTVDFFTQDDFINLINLQSLVSVQVYMVAINLLMIFFRAVFMITSLEGNLGLIVNTLGVAMANIIYFTISFLFLLVGFVAFAFFTFGGKPRTSQMTTPVISLFRVFAMLLGQQNFKGLKEVDEIMAMFFFFAFYIMVLFVMLNMFISILLSGYDVCVAELDKRDKHDKNIMAQIYEEVTQDLFGKFTATFLTCWNVVWSHAIKPFLIGITSCFKDMAAACDCGCRLPGPRQCFSVCLACCRKKEPNYMKELANERAFAKKLVLRARALEQSLASFDVLSERKVTEERKKLEGVVAKYKGLTHDSSQVDHEELKEKTVEVTQSIVRLEDTIEEVPDIAPWKERICMITFMLVFVVMLITMTRGEESYWLSQATVQPAVDIEWVDTQPLRLTSFEEIQSMEEVGEWAKSLVSELYANPKCRDSSGIVPVGTCDPTNNMAYVQEINNWNIGFLNTTFLRITIQPSCYKKNDEKRWKGGAAQLLSTKMSGGCVFSSCFEDALKQEGSCYSYDGESVNPTAIPFDVGKMPQTFYNYSKKEKLGPYGLHGGLAVSAGRTLAEAQTMLDALANDMWFSKNSASIAFDYITYNGNLDVFSHTMLGFSLLRSGTLKAERITRVFPLNLTVGGGEFETERIFVMVLFVIYVSMVIYFLFGIMLNDLKDDYFKGKRRKKPPYQFILTYYSWKNVWNRTDTLSIGITIVSIVIYIGYMADAFRGEYKFSVSPTLKYSIPVADASKYGMVAQSDPSRPLEDDWYLFSIFEKVGTTYDFYLNLAAVNAFFIAVKVVKYANVVSMFQIYASTLGEGAERMMYFALVICLLLVGWSLYFLVLFGTFDSRLSDLWIAINTCFEWMLGDFDLDRALAAREFAAILSFCFFQVMMYFVCINMFLATMLNTYSDTVGKNEIKMEKAKMNITPENDEIEVRYEDRQAAVKDMTLCRDPNSQEVYVKELIEGGLGLAGELGIADGGMHVGHMLVAINGDRVDWKNLIRTMKSDPEERKKTDEFKWDHVFEALPPDQGSGLVVVFKDLTPKQKGGFLDMMFSRSEQRDRSDASKATVRTFWRKYGAVTYTYSQILAELKNSRENGDADDADGDEKDAEGEDDEEKNGATKAELKNIRARTKKKLEGLLFSRKFQGEILEGVDPFDVSHMDHKPNADDKDVKVETDFEELNMLRDTILSFPISGDEVWLDCLMTQIENEMEDESVVTEVLRTSDLTDNHKGRTPGHQDALNRFYNLMSDILRILECKAKQKWYKCLQDESQQRLEMFKAQNSILHDYACELEGKFSQIMQKIHIFQAKKDTMIMKLSGLLDQTAYAPWTDGQNKDSMARPAIPKNNALGF